ncbi:MAG: energy transducer TonB [Candidatus Omnitrophota bacterium]
MRLLQKTLALSLTSHTLVFVIFVLALPSRVVKFTQVAVELVPLPAPPPGTGNEAGQHLKVREDAGRFLIQVYLPKPIPVPQYLSGPLSLKGGTVPPRISHTALLPATPEGDLALPLLLPENKGGRSLVSTPLFHLTGPGSRRKILYSPVPSYPDWAKERGVEAYLELKLWVEESGEVKEVSILKSSGYLDLDRICIETVSRWRFAPQEGEPTWAILPLRFHLT